MKPLVVLVFAGLAHAAIASGAADVAPKAATKVDATLSRLAAGGSSGGSGTLAPADPRPPVEDEFVAIDAVAAGDVAALESDLKALGAENVVAVGRVVSARLPVRSIAALDGLASLKLARAAAATTHPAADAPHAPH